MTLQLILVHQNYFPYENFYVGYRGTEKLTLEDVHPELNHKEQYFKYCYGNIKTNKFCAAVAQ